VTAIDAVHVPAGPGDAISDVVAKVVRGARDHGFLPRVDRQNSPGR
jgi:hypothetical protein